MRRYGNRPDPNQKYRNRPGAYGVIRGADGILLTVEARPGFDIDIAMPGGGIDPGESTLQALHREVMEETGWRVAPVRRLTTYQRFGYMPEYDLWARKVCHIYLCDAVRRISAPLDPNHTAIWTTPDVAVEMLSGAGDADVLAGILHRL